MSTATTDLWRMCATELAATIRSRRVSSEEAVEAHLRRIEEVNPAINAVVIVMGEEALEAAKQAARALAAGGELPPLHGVPFTVKANVDVIGTPTTLGAKALANTYPDLDAPVVERLRAAGAIPIGRTNLPTFGMGWVCESELWGATANPWDRSRTPGASSGGEAAALATGMSPLGLGNDGLGSLRWPAQCCGVCSLRATLGRIPRATAIEGTEMPISGQLVDVEGPLARRVNDLRTAYEILAGPSPRDPWTVPAPLYGPEPERPVDVALVPNPAGQGAAKQVQDGVRTAGAALEDAGYVVEEVEPTGIDTAAKVVFDMLGGDWRAISPLLSPSMRRDTKRVWSALLELAGDPEPARCMQSYITRLSLLKTWAAFQEQRPVIVAPVLTDVPFNAGKGLTIAEMREIAHGLRMTIAVNLLGLPAVTIPVGITDGLPQAVQVIGPRFREDLCLDAAAALEDRLGIITPIDPR